MTQPDPQADVTTWALHYASLGWAVFPVGRPDDLKAPHRTVKSWDTQATSDPAEVVALFAGLTEPVGVGVHLGRSGLVVLDGDRPEDLETSLPVSGTGAWVLQGNPARRSLLFRQPAQEVGQTVRPWGEVKAQRGYVVLPPSPHLEGGTYVWLKRSGKAPAVLPEAIRQALPVAGESGAEKATGAEVMRFMERYQGTADMGALKSVTARLEVAIETNESLHPRVVGCLVQAMDEARAGAYPAKDAQAALRVQWLAGYRAQGRNPRADAEQEWRDLLQWAVGQANAKSEAEVEARRVMLGIATVPVVSQDEAVPMPRLPEAFWEARESHRLIKQAARSRLAGSDGVLLACLVRASTALDHRWVLPPIVQSLGSPNLFGCLVGHSGSGKSGGLSIAEELIFTADVLNETTMGTSGGLVDTFGEKIDGHWEQTSHHLLVTADEVDEFVANLAVGVGTGSAVRTAWTGGAIGGTYRGKDAKARVGRLSYRMGVLVGAQPKRVGGFLGGKEREGGTPQRFVWLSSLVDDDLTVATRPDWPGGLESYAPWAPSGGRWIWPHGSSPIPGTEPQEDRWHVGVPAGVVDLIQEQHLEQARGLTVDGLGHHDNFNRLKIALALALIDRPADPGPVINVEDWALAGMVLDTSNAVRDWLEAQAAQQAVEEKADTLSVGMAADRASHVRVSVLAARIRALLEGRRGGMTKTEVNQALSSRDKPILDLALQSLIQRSEAWYDLEARRWYGGERPE